MATSQNIDFNGQIADATIILATHTKLSLQKRFSSYETMCELFRVTQQQLLDLTLWERLVKVLIKMLVQMATILCIDVEEMIEKLMQCDQTCKQLLAMFISLDEPGDDDNNKLKTDVWTAVT